MYSTIFSYTLGLYEVEKCFLDEANFVGNGHKMLET